MIDHILAFALLIAVPAHSLWRSRKHTPFARTRTARYLGTIWVVGGLLALLALDWLLSARPVTLLGLGAPTTHLALIGLVIAFALLASLCILSLRRPLSSPAASERAGAELLPQTQSEIRLFALLAFAAGFGWEVLYRGFLLFYLQPYVGLTGAVFLSAIVYGAAQEFRSLSQSAASIAAAFSFTIGYALTDNLWWLILLHTGLPLVGFMIAGKRLSAELS